ncbi:hypothetical protein SH2C18_10250 [Clostridium sediminicola]|uniref:anti-sigma factor family protein n=1 Tax=Clostridium sediminicola TaxID=3114879 RepID=UPI0031F230FE
MNCKLFKEKINDYINNQLSEKEKLEMEIHTEKCEECRRILKEEISIDNMFKNALKNNEVQFKSQKSTIMNTIDVNKYKASDIKLKNKKYYFKKVALVAAAFAFIFILNRERLIFRMGNNYEMSLDDASIEESENKSDKSDLVEESKMMEYAQSDEKFYNEEEMLYVTYMREEEFNSMIGKQKKIKDNYLSNSEYKAEIIEDKGIFIQSLNDKDFGVWNISFNENNIKAYDITFCNNKLMIITGNKESDGGNRIYSYDILNKQITLEYQEKNANTLIVNFEKGDNDSIMVVKKIIGRNTSTYDYVREELKQNELN